MGIDVNGLTSFLKGYLDEQERQKTEKKMNTLMQGKDMDVSIDYDPISGKAIYQLKPKQQIDPYQSEQLAIEKQKIAQQQQMMGLFMGQGGQGGNIRAKSANVGGVNFERQPTPEEQQQEIGLKAQEQSKIASEKERQVNISKISRLTNIANVVEQEFLRTSPYKGAITKTGLQPLLGQIDIMKAPLQATDAQRADRAYGTFTQGIRAQLARALGDVGNLSEPEQKAAMNLIPSLRDSHETGMRKLSMLRNFIKTIQSSTFEQSPTQNQPNTFATEEEAVASGIKGEVIINGRRARID